MTVTHTGLAGGGYDDAGPVDPLEVTVDEPGRPGRGRRVRTPVSPVEVREEGGTAKLDTVVLDAGAHRGAVTVTPVARGADGTGSTGAVTVGPASLTFTGGPGGNWGTPQAVTVTGVADDALGDRRATIVHTVSGAGSGYEVALGLRFGGGDGDGRWTAAG